MSGSQFETGEDFVAARLSIDVPTEGISALRELTQEVERYRVGAEAAARAQDSFVQYLQQSVEMANQAATAQQNLLAAMQQTMELQQRLATGSATAGGHMVPQGYVDPFAGSGAGRGAEAGTGGGGGGGGAGTQATIDNLRDQDPRAYLNMQAQRGNLRTGDIPAASPGDESLQQIASRVSARQQENVQQQGNPAESGGGGGPGWMRGLRGGLSEMGEQVMNETGLGKLKESAAALPGLKGGALAGLGIGGLASGAMAAFGMSQKAGEMYQDYKNQGLVRGGGAKEGFDFEMATRALAMNPFISLEQSRQIMQAGLREGYTGKSFETVTEFMTKNFTDMNIAVSDSVEMLRKNVNEGGQSLMGLNMSLGMLKDLSQSGSTSFPELLARYKSTSGALIGAGMSGGAASEAAMMAGQMYATGPNSQLMKGVGDSMVAGMGTNSVAMTMMSMDNPALQGLMPGAMAMAMGDGKDLAMGMEGVAKKLAMQIWQGSGSPEEGSKPFLNAASMFQQLMAQMGNQLTPRQALQMFTDLTQGRSAMKDAQGRVNDERKKQVTPTNKGMMEMLSDGLTLPGRFAIGAAGGAAQAIGSAALGFVSGNWQGFDTYNAKGGKFMDSMLSDGNPFDMKMPVLDQISSEYGSKGFDVVDKSGKAIDFSRSNKDQMNKLAAGEYNVRPKGTQGSGVGVAGISGLNKDDLRAAMGGGGTSQVTGTLNISMDPSAQKAGFSAPTTITLTPHEQKANMGYGGATPNNAPPGEGPLTRGRSGW